MRIYLVRHAAAVTKAEAGRDEDRSLTDQGREQARALGAAMSVRGLDLGAVVSSPLVRTHQTAVELADGVKPTLPDVILSDLLAPGELKPRKLSKFLEEVGVESIAVIGHYPGLPAPNAIWDYENENPLLDARGFEVEGERERPNPEYNRQLNKVLANGGRLYVDGAHPEYSIPECSNPREVVAFERIGERILARSLAEMTRARGREIGRAHV